MSLLRLHLSGRDETERPCVRALLSMLTRLDFMPHAVDPTEIWGLMNGTIRSIFRKITIIIM